MKLTGKNPLNDSVTRHSTSTYLALVCITILCLGMGGGDKSTGPLGPTFIGLEEKEPSYQGKIIGGESSALVTDISFGGKTTLGQIRSQSDESFTTLDLANIARIIIIQPHYQFAGQEFSKANIITNNGILVSNLLIPYKLNISAVAQDTGFKKTWYIHALDRIEISHAKQAASAQTKDTKAQEEETEEQPESQDKPSLLERAKDTAKEAEQKIAAFARQAGEAITAAYEKTKTYFVGKEKAAADEEGEEE